MPCAGISRAPLHATRYVRCRIAVIEQGRGDAGLGQSVHEVLPVFGPGKASPERRVEHQRRGDVVQPGHRGDFRSPFIRPTQS